MHLKKITVSCCEIPQKAASDSRSPQSTDSQPHVLNKDTARLFHATVTQTCVQVKSDNAVIFCFAYWANEHSTGKEIFVT